MLNTLLTPIRLYSHLPDWSALLHNSELPDSLRVVLRDVLRRTRLWHRERADVARELIAHFQDGLASGSNPDELARTFGDPHAAARLIRRAKIRGRPWWYHACRRANQAFGIALAIGAVLYVFLFLRYTITPPTIARNFTAELNAPGLAVPESDRAWPMYLDALRVLRVPPKKLLQNSENPWPSKPGHPLWPEAAAYIDSVQSGIDLLARAADKPTLGYPLSNAVPRDFATLRNELNDYRPLPGVPEFDIPDDNPQLIGVLLPHLGEFRSFARSLVVDARRALELQDPDRFVRDIRTMLGLARHSADPPFLIGSLVRFAIADLAFQTVRDALTAGVLTQNHLTDLAHRLAAVSDDQIDLNFSTERSFFLDVLQRSFTDNGHGEGRLNADGLRLLAAFQNDGTTGIPPATASPTALYLLGPISAAIVAPRAEQLAAYDRFLDAARRDAETPPWQRGPDSSSATLDALTSSTISRARYFVIASLAPAVDKAVDARDRVRTLRDATLAALALESSKLRSGRYPDTLDQLIPTFLPALPLDPMTGAPLRYHLTERGPVLYSVGSDRRDDFGVYAPTESLDALSRSVRPRNPDAKDHLGRPLPPAQPADWILYAPGLTPPDRTNRS